METCLKNFTILPFLQYVREHFSTQIHREVDGTFSKSIKAPLYSPKRLAACSFYESSEI